jgi:hypothetical protein
VLATGIAANLEFLELMFCSTHLQSMYPMCMHASTLDCPIPSTTNSIDAEMTLSLSVLHSLKVTLDNVTFLVLATGTCPSSHTSPSSHPTFPTPFTPALVPHLWYSPNSLSHTARSSHSSSLATARPLSRNTSSPPPQLPLPQLPEEATGNPMGPV